MALKIAQDEKQKGNKVVIFSDDLGAAQVIKDALNNSDGSGSVECVDDLFNRGDYLGYEQSIFEIMLLSKANLIYAGDSGFSRLAMMIGNVAHTSPYSYFNPQEQLEILQSSVEKYDFHPSHKAFACMQLFVLGRDYDAPSSYLVDCTRGAVTFYRTDVYNILYVFALLNNGEFERANSVLEQIYHQNREDFLKLLLESFYGGFVFGFSFLSYFSAFNAQVYPYLAYFALRIGIFMLGCNERHLVDGYGVILQYVQDYGSISNFAIKAQEMGKFSEILSVLKNIEVRIISNAFAEINALQRKVNSLEYQVGIQGKSYSQYGQDLFVKQYFLRLPKKEKYIFVDIGANDGITLSNTYMLEHSLDQNWEGILIEADSNVFKKCLENRESKKNTKYNVALCNTDGEVNFMQIQGPIQMLSGIMEEYDKRHLERIEAEIRHSGGSYEIIKMQGAKFSSIMKKHKDISVIDYLSIDVEGGEMKILESIDFTSIKVKLLGIEDNYPDNSGIYEYLTQRGFREIARLGCDRIFERD